MKKSHCKSKMVTFRLSPDEYTEVCKACDAHGLESVSELARVAIQILIQTGPHWEPAACQLMALKDRVRLLTCDLDRLTKRLEGSAIEPDPAQE
jgi:hypothetical protein